MNILTKGFNPQTGEIGTEEEEGFVGDESDEFNEYDEYDESTTSADSSSTRIDEARWLKLAGILKD